MYHPVLPGNVTRVLDLSFQTLGQHGRDALTPADHARDERIVDLRPAQQLFGNAALCGRGEARRFHRGAQVRRAQMGVGYLAQEASVFRRLSVEDNIRAVLEMTDFSKEYQTERVESLIEEFRLQKVRKSLGIQLSGGERRRTEIARAVAINPAFILLDEPFAGVDPIAVEDIQSIVATLKHKNIGVIITDHNVDETLAITDRTYLLYEGKILKTGTAEELAADPMVRKVYLGQHFELKKSHQLTQQMKNRKGQQAQQAGEETETQE